MLSNLLNLSETNCNDAEALKCLIKTHVAVTASSRPFLLSGRMKGCVRLGGDEQLRWRYAALTRLGGYGEAIN